MMRPASTLRGSPSLAPVTAACPRCRGPLVQLEEPTCLPCGWVDYSLPGFTCGICREPLTGDRLRYCSALCVTVAGNRRKAQAARMRRARRRCVRCGIPTNGGTYCPRHKASVRSAGIDWRARRRAAGRCLKCGEPRINATHCTRHRREHNAMISAARQARLAAGCCRQCAEPGVRGTFCESHRQQNNVQQAS